MLGREGGLHLHPHVSRLSSFVRKKTIEKVLDLPVERRQIPFLVSKEVLERCSIWDNMSGSTGEEAMAAYKKALETISVKKIAPKATVSDGGDDDDVQFIRTSKRKATTRSTPSASKKKAKSSEPAKISSMSSDDHTKVLANLNEKVFPSLASHLQE
ncbi:hypothetical protein YC2023_051069 [Brassica napus]